MSQPPVEGYRLSKAQQRLWRQHGSHIGPHRVRASVSIEGPLDPARLCEALRTLGARHEILRTTYRQTPDATEPLQLVQDHLPPSFAYVDLSGRHPAEQTRIVDARFHEMSERMVDLTQGPVWHADLLALSSEHFRLLLMWPSQVADAATVGHVMREIARVLDMTRLRRRGNSTPALQHVDISEWQHQVFDADGTAAARQFWRAVPFDTIVGCRLALVRPRVDGGVFSPRTIPSALPHDVMTGVARWAARHACAMTDVLLACWLLLAWRLTEQSTIAIGIESPGRTTSDLASAIGPLARTLPVRIAVDRRWTFLEWVARVRAASQEARRWHELFAWELLDAQGPIARDGFCPLACEVIDEEPVLTAGGLRCAIERVESCLDRFELKLSLVRGDARAWEARWVYDPDVCTSDQVAGIAEQYVSVLQCVASGSPPALAEVDVRGARERIDVITNWNATEVEWPADVGETLAAWIARGAAIAPDAVAVWTEAGQWSHAQVHADADRLARRLQALGVGPEARVAVWLTRGQRLIAALLGVVKAGGAYVPLDPSYPATRLASQLADAQVSVVLTERSCAAAVPPGAYAVEVLDAPELEAGRPGQATAHTLEHARSAASARAILAPSQLAYIIYTSGSTGEPKGAMNAHAGVVNRLAWMQAAYGLDQGDRVLQKTSISFDVSVWELFWPLGTGATLVLARPDGQRDPQYLGGLIARAGVTVAHFVPSMLEAFAAAGGLAMCGSLRLLVSSGEGLPGPLASRVRAAWPGQLENLYGPTEAAVDVTWHPCAATDAAAPIVPIGRPIANARLFIVDSAGEPVPVGVTGELMLGGVPVGRGYWNRPAATAASFVPDRFSGVPGARLYRTGDRARYRADGVVEYAGRADHQVKLRGHRIELGEIEAALRVESGIRDAVVLLREDTPGDPRLVAYVVPGPEQTVTGAEPTVTADVLQRRLRTRLPDAWVPAEIVTLAALPLTANGKVDRRALPAPSGARPALAAAYVAPRTPTEARLAAIWAEVLRRDRVGIDDNFFALGGDSILSLQIVARAARDGLQLTPGRVFEHQTIAALAALADEGGATVRDQSSVTGIVPLTPIQAAFFERSLADAHHYNYAVAFELTHPIAAARLGEVWLRLQHHHDALRLRYRRDPWRQINADVDAATALTSIDLTRVDVHAAERLWMRIAAAAQASLDLTAGPLARAVLVSYGESAAARLLVIAHHLLVDGVSSRVLIEDLHELCARARNQEQHQRWSLPPKTQSFKTWSERLTAAARNGAFDRDLAFWEEMDQAAAALPIDEVRGPNDIGSEQIWRGSLSADETDGLVHGLPVTLGVHVQEALVASVLHALADWTRASRWRIDLEGHGRDALEAIEGDSDVSRTVGWFTSIFPVRVAWSDATADPVSALRAVRGALRRIPGSGASYGALRYLAGGERAAALRAAPQPEILFNYWGLMDHVVVSSPLMRPTRAPVGPLRAATQRRDYVFEISASLTGGRLHLQWTSSANLHRLDTVERLATRTLETLRTLVALPSSLRASLQTPADFALARISEDELHALSERHGPLAGIYPLSPLQEGLVFHQLAESDRGLHVLQLHARIRGPLAPETFRAAWESVVARHDTLRTAFIWERRDGLLQVVQETAPLPWRVEDWRALSSETHQIHLSDYLEGDARAGFSLDRPPLMRVALLRLGDEDWEVVWTSHHLVLDGWSVQLVLRDVFTAYVASGRDEPALASSGRFADYIAWLQRQDETRTEAFWRRMFEGLRASPLLAPGGDAASASSRGSVRAAISPAVVEALRRLGQEQRITMNTWFAGAWAMLLAYCTKHDDVVIGTVVSGRPPRLPGVETIAGLFANTLPIRVRLTRDVPAMSFFADVQRLQTDARDYEHTPLVRAQAWSGLPPGTPLFDTMFAYENYPGAAIWSEKSDLRVVNLDTSIPRPYPLAIDIAEIHAALTVDVTYDERAGRALATFVRDGFETVFTHLMASPTCTVGHLLSALDARVSAISSATRQQRRDSRRQALRAMLPAQSV